MISSENLLASSVSGCNRGRSWLPSSLISVPSTSHARSDADVRAYLQYESNYGKVTLQAIPKSL